MDQIRAVVVDPSAPGKLAIKDVPAPSPYPSQALVRLRATSLNPGEIRRARSAEPGWRPGWDFAGIVEKAAADGSGPRLGDRVVGLLPQAAWAEIVAVPTDSLAVIPQPVTFEQAAALPVAGLTALYSLERNGAIIGKRVLITGASGGVGHLACQLAAEGGARVVASVRRAEREVYAREAGAQDVVVGEDLKPASKLGPYHMVLESVGGKSLTSALTMLAQNGMCILYGASETPDVSFDARRFYLIGGATLYGFILFHELKRCPPSDGLTRLLEFVANGSLRPLIDVRAQWTEIDKVSEDLWQRKIAGKAVLTF